MKMIYLITRAWFIWRDL